MNILESLVEENKRLVKDIKIKSEQISIAIQGLEALLYSGDKEFLNTIEDMLDNPYLRTKANKYLEPKLEGFRWSERVNKWFDGWKFFDDLKPMSDTESYKRIMDFIHTKKSVSKKDILEHLNWGVRISFSESRNRLRLENTIKFTKNRYEVI